MPWRPKGAFDREVEVLKDLKSKGGINQLVAYGRTEENHCYLIL